MRDTVLFPVIEKIALIPIKSSQPIKHTVYFSNIQIMSSLLIETQPMDKEHHQHGKGEIPGKGLQ